jgi:hypothetical protein
MSKYYDELDQRTVTYEKISTYDEDFRQKLRTLYDKDLEDRTEFDARMEYFYRGARTGLHKLLMKLETEHRQNREK